MTTMRDVSKQEWTGGATREDIRTGCFQRIADATELMAKNYAALIAERDRYQRWHEEQKASNDRMARTIRALRGHITRLKRA